jgi:hypothetical protein
MKGSGTKATGGKQRGTKIVVGSTSVSRLGKSKRAHFSQAGKKNY